MTSCPIIHVAYYRGRHVALKKRQDLKDKIEIMRKLESHPNIIQFIGEVIYSYGRN
jgi:hypothetical protein